MKCIKNRKTGEVLRLPDEDAKAKVSAEPMVYHYTPKSVWRRQERVSFSRSYSADRW